jgi:hypothetical protein
VEVRGVSGWRSVFRGLGLMKRARVEGDEGLREQVVRFVVEEMPTEMFTEWLGVAGR